MTLEDFYYHLPEELIAQYPLEQRDQARLLVIDRAREEIRHDIFANIDRYLPKSSTLVVNNSKVTPARLLGRRKSGGRVEIFLLKQLSDGYCYEVLMRPMRRLNNGEVIDFEPNGVTAQVKDKDKRIVRFNRKNLTDYLQKNGHIPLPPYIKRQDEPIDHEFYQTVYAKTLGSVASPTAGLHFTKPLMDKIKQHHTIEQLTLHVNYGTFKAVEEADITQHTMHTEDYAMTRKSYDHILKAKQRGEKIVAVGTTSTRVLESIAKTQQLKGTTNIFIYPGFDFQIVDCLITNFHLPYSTLLMLVYAFGGMHLMSKAYKEAIESKYRFYSYGDAMIIV